MKHRYPIVVAAILSALLAAAAAAASERVYKWTDENGVVHFSASPPADRGAERITLPDYTPPTPPPDETSSPAETPPPDGRVFAEAAPPDNSAVEEANRRKQCEKGRNMLAQLEPRPRVYRLDADGNQVYLSDEERLDLIEQARQLVAEHCD